jgi:hypothetical protein
MLAFGEGGPAPLLGLFDQRLPEKLQAADFEHARRFEAAQGYERFDVLAAGRGFGPQPAMGTGARGCAVLVQTANILAGLLALWENELDQAVGSIATRFMRQRNATV